MNILNALFSSEKIIDNASRAVDALVFTGEEKVTFLLKAMQATLPMAISRRILAFGITAVWAVLVLLWAFLICIGLKDKADLIYQGIKDMVVNPFNIIVGFYFLKSITDAMKK
jgi:hypothetical protein